LTADGAGGADWAEGGGGGGGIPEAPLSGGPYGRQAAAWVDVATHLAPSGDAGNQITLGTDQRLMVGPTSLTSEVSGTLPLANGGTGATDAPGARTNLGLGTAATAAATDFAPAAQGVLNGNAHDHLGGDGGQIAYSSLGGVPTSFTPASHTHGNITNAGAVGTTANLPLITGTAGAVVAGAFGTAVNTFCQGNDSRLSNARTPTAHASTHNAGGADALAIDAAAATGSLRTLGTTATAACAGDDSRLSNARTPTAHAASHATGQADAITPAAIGAQAAMTTATKAEMEAGTVSALRAMSPLLARQGEDARFAAPPILGSATPNRGDFTEVRLNNNADPVNFERFSLSWVSGTAVIDVSAGGTGVQRDFQIRRGGVIREAIGPNNKIIYSPTGADFVTFGTELLTTADWVPGTGWAVTTPGTYQHTIGQTATLTHPAVVANATRYRLSWTITGRTAGSVTLAFGGQSIAGVTATDQFAPTTTNTATLVITPTSDFNGEITPSLMPMTSQTPTIRAYRDASNVTRSAVRVPNLTNTVFFGPNAGQWCLATGNSGFGSGCMPNLTSGMNNSAFGANALFTLTTGKENVAFGMGTFHGAATGDANVAVGYNAGRYAGSGTTSNSASTNSVYLGYTSRAAAVGTDNEIAIGANALGLGSNTAVIGNTSITKTRLQGTVETTLDYESITAGKGVLLRSPNGTRYRISVNDSGAVIATLAP
jgi:hypothetical protein